MCWHKILQYTVTSVLANNFKTIQNAVPTSWKNLSEWTCQISKLSAIYLHSFPLEMDIQLEVDINSPALKDMISMDPITREVPLQPWSILLFRSQKPKIPRTWSQTGIGRVWEASGSVRQHFSYF